MGADDDDLISTVTIEVGDIPNKNALQDFRKIYLIFKGKF